MTEPVYHLAEPSDWARSGDKYQPAGFEEVGFIHCSRAEQVAPVARSLYTSHNRLILLTIDPTGLPQGALLYEDLDGIGEEFPHLYSPLPTTAVIHTGPYLTHLEEGLWLESRWDREWMDHMLHPDFTKIGMSGRAHGRRETIEATRVELEIELPLDEYRLDLVDEDVAMVRYMSRARYSGVEKPAQRCSIWVNTNDGWRLRFHQATPFL